ncbi:MAG: nucleotide-binding protein [Candidatus Thorarchaeota archaeon]|nr:nucleotide-binding protein [Candidatus Thorarchaeota archaeon]
MPLCVILDTNFLTVPAQFGVDVFSEAERVLERSIEFILLESVIDEIKTKLERAGKTERRMFKVALDLTERCKVVKIDQSMKTFLVDDQLLEYAVSVRGVLATNDKELRERAAKRGVPVLILRGKKHLELKGSIF